MTISARASTCASFQWPSQESYNHSDIQIIPQILVSIQHLLLVQLGTEQC